MGRTRRSHESGHKPKLLVIIDETPECGRAVYYASRRAARSGASVLMLRVVETRDQSQQWLGVADIMRAEAHEDAAAMLARFAALANRVAGIKPEQVIREGETTQEILNLIDEEEDISMLVLAAGTGNEGPGPLLSELCKTIGSFPIPLAVVPGHLSDQDIDAVA